MSDVNYKTIFGSLMIFFIGYILEYCLNAFVSYHIIPALFGDFSLALRLMMVVGPLYLLGMPSSLIKYVSQFQYSGDKKSILQFLKWVHLNRLKGHTYFATFFRCDYNCHFLTRSL